MAPALDDDAAWSEWQAQWALRADTVYLNHGSFGPPPRPVQAARQRFQAALDEQPMDFFVRQYEPAFEAARTRLAQFVGANPAHLVFVENATAGMNHVAYSTHLRPDEEVLLTDHEYGAVTRIWQRHAERTGCRSPRTVALPMPVSSADALVEAIFAAVTAATRLLVVSHITSPTAITLPVAEICRRAQPRGLAVCIDGPHAIAQLPLALAELNCDYFVASCHKWLSAPFGSGFMYVHRRRHAEMQPALLSWGRVNHEQHPQPRPWDGEFFWSGTRDPSPYLAVPAAIEFLETCGLELFRARIHALARYARERLLEHARREPLVPDDSTWYGGMAHVPLAAGPARPLQHELWRRYRIEVPIVDFQGARYVRVSCHLYNTRQHIDRLVRALTELDVF